MTNTASCPVCENICSSQASTCPKCGHPLKQEVVTKESPQNGSFTCPKCGSNQISTFEMVYSQGTSSGRVSAGTITGNGSFAFTGGNVSSQSELARQVAPPPKPEMNGWILYGLVVVSFIMAGISLRIILSPISFLIVIVSIFSVGAYFHYSSIQNKMPEYLEKVERWKKAMICFRCGNKWYSSEKNPV